MIFTVNLNPSLDTTVEVEELIYDDANAIVDQQKRAGGKGLVAARVIKELGGQSNALGLAGGYNGLQLEGSLISEGLVCDFTRIREETKTNITIYQRKKKLQTLLSAPEPFISPLEIAMFYGKIKEIASGSFVIISGNPPGDVNENFYAQLVTALNEKGAKVILDADREALKLGVKAGPYLIKPNIHEFGRLVERNVSDVGEILDSVDDLLNTVEYIVVSLGVRGAVGLSRESRFHVIPPKVKVRSSIGAGDSLVGGAVFGLSEGYSFVDAVTLGVACGTASTLNQENSPCRKEDVFEIKKDIVVKYL